MRIRRPSVSRNFRDPRYATWRAEIRKRDKNRCRRCKSTKSLQAHHIKRWADFPQLRYAVGNGILLCRKCHGMMWDNEAMYEPVCRALLARPLNG